MGKPETMMIDDQLYIRADSAKEGAAKVDGMDYVIVRTYSAGVHAGYLKERNGKEVKLINSRRLYYWEGAATLSQLSQDGTSKPSKCKFPCEVPEIELTEAIEVIKASEKSRLCIAGVKVWAA